MSQGFEKEKVGLELTVYQDEVDKLLKKYKNVKKYMKSSIYTIKEMDGNENFVSRLIQEAEDNPL
jgi:hypothetical protein